MKKVLEKTESLTEVIRKIEAKEQALSWRSDKLRRAVKRIFNTFGDPDLCQLCSAEEKTSYHFPYTTFNESGNHVHITEQEKNQLLAKGTHILADLTGTTIKDGKRIIIRNKGVHNFIPKVRLSLNLVGEVFSVANTKFFRPYSDEIEYRLASRKGKLVVLEYFEDEEIKYEVDELPRRALKDMVEKQAITEFLNRYLQQLGQAADEYESVSAVAEKMVSVLA